MPRKRKPQVRRLCEICGALIPYKPGMPAKTCGTECAAERHRRRELARYYEKKDTPQWRETRQNYLEKIRAKLDADPEFRAIFRAYANDRFRKSQQKRNADPTLRAADLERKRIERQEWRERLLSEPMAWEAHKFKARAWYAGLSDDDKDRIYRNGKPPQPQQPIPLAQSDP